MAIMLNLLDGIFSQEKNELKSQATPIYTNLFVITQLCSITEMDSRADVFLTNFGGFRKSFDREHPSMSDKLFLNALLRALKSFDWSMTDN